jgi:hypothetical protein
VTIDGRKFPSGVLETPRFPEKFPLPLECVWVFDKSGLKQEEDREEEKYWIHLYFTQVRIVEKQELNSSETSCDN